MMAGSCLPSSVDAEALRQKIDDVTECAICFSSYKKPKFLPCAHTFCLECINKTFDDLLPGEKGNCPLCRAEFTVPQGGLDKLAANFFVEQLMDLKQVPSQLPKQTFCQVCCDEDEKQLADSFCTECQEFFCPRCSQLHQKQKITKCHHVVTIIATKSQSGRNAVNCCQIHSSERIKLYCKDCNTVCCMMCFVETHKQHNCSNIDKFGAEFRTELQSMAGSMAALVAESIAVEQSVNDEHRKFVAETQTSQKAIIDEADKLKQLIDNNKDELLLQSSSARDQRDIVIKARNTQLQQHRAVMDKFLKSCDDLFGGGSVSEIALRADRMRSQATQLIRQHRVVLGDKLEQLHVTFQPSQTFDNQTNIVGTVAVNEVMRAYRQVHETVKGPAVRGVVILEGRLYVARKNTPSLAVHDPTTMTIISNFSLPAGLDSPCNMAGCSTEKCLYITVSEKQAVYKVRLAGPSGAPWSVNSEPDGVSVAPNTNVIVTLRETNKLVEFTAQGRQLREISLVLDKLVKPRHAILLPTNEFLLCHGWGSGPYRLCLLSKDGKLLKSANVVPRNAVKNNFSPTHLALTRNELFVLAVDFYGGRVMKFDTELKYIEDAVPVSAGLKEPFRVCLDMVTECLYVGEYSSGGRVVVFGT